MLFKSFNKQTSPCVPVSKKRFGCEILLFTLFFNCQSAQNGFDSMSFIPPGACVGSDQLFTLAFVDVKPDTAFVDLIVNQKYPRELFSDTLFLDNEHKKWIGRKSVLYEKNKKALCRSKWG